MSSDELRRSLETLLKPKGDPLGVPTRNSGRVRRVKEDPREAGLLFSYLEMIGRSVDSPDYPGWLLEMPGLGHVGLRTGKGGEPTIDVNVNIDGLRHVKLKYVGRNS